MLLFLLRGSTNLVDQIKDGSYVNVPVNIVARFLSLLILKVHLYLIANNFMFQKLFQMGKILQYLHLLKIKQLESGK